MQQVRLALEQCQYSDSSFLLRNIGCIHVGYYRSTTFLQWICWVRQIHFLTWPAAFLLRWLINLSWTDLFPYPTMFVDGSREWTLWKSGNKTMKKQAKWSKTSPTCFSLERCMLASAMNVILILSCDLYLELRFKKFCIYYLDDLWRYRVFNGRLREESGEMKQSVVKFKVAGTRLQMPILWQKL